MTSAFPSSNPVGRLRRAGFLLCGCSSPQPAFRRNRPPHSSSTGSSRRVRLPVCRRLAQRAELAPPGPAPAADLLRNPPRSTAPGGAAAAGPSGAPTPPPDPQGTVYVSAAEAMQGRRQPPSRIRSGDRRLVRPAGGRGPRRSLRGRAHQPCRRGHHRRPQRLPDGAGGLGESPAGRHRCRKAGRHRAGAGSGGSGTDSGGRDGRPALSRTVGRNSTGRGWTTCSPLRGGRRGAG